MKSKKSTEITHYLDDVKMLGVHHFKPEDKVLDHLTVRVVSGENENKIISSGYYFDSILKQCVLVDPKSFKSIAKRFSVITALNTIDKYEKTYKKPFYSFSQKQVDEVVSDLSKTNKSTITIQTITQNLLLVEKFIHNYVDEFNTPLDKARVFTNLWKNISVHDINNKAKRAFVTKAELSKLINGHLFGERTPQYNGLALLVFKGVKMSRVVEKNEISLITLDDLNNREHTILVGRDNFRRKISFNNEEWLVIERMVAIHDSTISDFLIQPFSSTRAKSDPVTRWSLVSRLKQLSKETFNDADYASYKNLRAAGINNLYAQKLLDHGYRVVKVFGPNIRPIAIECLQQFGELEQEIGEGDESRIKSKASRLKLSLIQYEKSF